MVYLNQAATTWPKPRRVLEAHAAALSAPPRGQFRSSARGGADEMGQCRQKLGALLGIGDCERIFFCSGASTNWKLQSMTAFYSVTITVKDQTGRATVFLCREKNLIPKKSFRF